MPTQITIYSDYVCPYCLLAEKVIRDATQDRDVSIQWHPFELRPDPIPTLRVEDEYLPRVWRQSVYPMAERLGVPIKLPNISPQPRTAKAFEVFAFAEMYGLGEAFSLRTLRAFFQEEQNIGEVEVLVRLAEDVGLKGEDVRRALTRETFSKIHRKALMHAKEEAHITAVPTILIGARRFEGVPRFEQIIEALELLERASEQDESRCFGGAYRPL